MTRTFLVGALLTLVTYGCEHEPDPVGLISPTKGLASTQAGTVTTYSSRADLLAAWTGQSVTIDFSTNDAGAPITNPSTDAFFPALSLRGATFRNVESYYNEFVYYFANYPIHVDLPPGTHAVGTELRLFYGAPGTFTMKLSDGSVYTIPVALGDPQQYFGAVSTSPLSWIEVNFDHDYLVLSNFVIGTSPITPPNANAGGPYTGVEGTSIGFDASASSDPNGLSLTYSWDLGDGSPVATGIHPTHTYRDNGLYPVTLTVSNRTASATATVNASITNAPPVNGAITAPVAPVQVNTPVNAAIQFTDAGIVDTHTGAIDWGDGSSTSATVSESGGSGSATASHTYTSAGVYTLTFSVTDKDGGTATSAYEFVVVYDPTGGFVTGGGWINSPPGAFTANSSLTGKATFGFVSRYQQGASVPSGNTQFQFQAANFSFKSTSYDWLVIAGAQAKYKGSGSINGSGDYGFMLSAVDGAVNGGGGTDNFRIKIWDKGTGAVVYDNQQGASDDAAATAAIMGGEIVIHH